MSTKIWTAYRMKNPLDLWPLVQDIREKGTRNCRKVITSLYGTVVANVDETSEAYLNNLKQVCSESSLLEQRARLYTASQVIRDHYKATQVSNLRDYFDFDVSVGFRQFEQQVILIPYADMTMRDVLDFLKRDPRLEDYHYQNQTDRDEKISREDWDERGAFYSRMLDSGAWQDLLTLDICSYSLYPQIDPFLDLYKALK